MPSCTARWPRRRPVADDGHQAGLIGQLETEAAEILGELRTAGGQGYLRQ